ncbi:F-box only protein 22-like [Acipenser oxyrinchus oxyrinchus]|uniref:F-box only protein 22-like n=1 Tax=Acipenser oxyrinchus oxyrinchus TaxID=40147 RepID=A0AAD8CWK7_ACIOX|nr:F-box only protein 22-like [Acipenser oxyrinchus oxyrinchus]KAK1160755.1 F-box only protein 22-like [Acipenser oxyrinchus oxyrinchus]
MDLTIESKAGYVLSNVAEVVEKILTFVPTKSLFHTASVCALWRECARRVLRKQQNVTWISASGSSGGSGHLLPRKLDEEVENVYLLPKTVLIMADVDAFNQQDNHFLKKKVKKSSSSGRTDELRKLFPKGCDILGIAVPGIVLTPMGSHSNPPQEFEEGEAGFAIMFPNIDGINIRSFHFCKRSFSSMSLEEAGLVNNPSLRVVLLFGYEAFKSGAARFLNQVIEPLSKANILLAGGHIESVTSPEPECCNPGSYGVVGLALSGSKIQGASVLLEQDVNSEKTAEAAVQRLKSANIPQHNTLGFMFACVGRGRHHYNSKNNVEADAFRKIFPNIPLFGFFGNGEIGCDKIVTEDYTLTDAENLQHGYSTVMALVHLG